MNQLTPNMSIFIPVTNQQNYAQAFAAGMMNIDAHDHTGAPTKGVPITSAGIGTGAVDYTKLATNVADATTGIAAGLGTLKNQLQIIGLLQSIFKIAFGTNGFISKNGTGATARTITAPTNGSLSVTFGDGIGGDPVLSVTGTNTTLVAFSAGGTNQGALLGDGTYVIMRFPTAGPSKFLFQQGSAFNTTKFTAPVTGLYYFNVSVNLSGVTGGNETDIGLWVNGVQPGVVGPPTISIHTINTQELVYSGANEFTLTGSMFLSLTAGDYVQVIVMCNQIAAGTVTILGGLYQGWQVA